jgi:cysteine desulfurase family protein (TIGR01976 family)
MTAHTYNPQPLRDGIPSLKSGTAHFDGPGGTQTPAVVADAIAEALLGPLSNRGRATTAEIRADDYVLAARSAMADLLGTDSGGVVFARSMTQVTFDIARTLAGDWGPGDEVIVTRLDHDANVRPWVIAAERSGATIRWAAFDPATGDLPATAVTDLIGPNTRLIAVTGASNLIGTRPDIPAITAAARTAGALSYIDGVHLTAHAPVDVAALGADFYACSPYKFLGPHLGVLAAAPELLDRLHPDKLLPATNAVPERFELGTLSYELLAGVTAAVDVLAGLVPGEGARRQRILASMAALEAYEDALSARLRAGLDADERITVYSNASHRTPTHLFTVAGIDSVTVSAHLADHGVDAPASNFYALECSRHLGLGDAGGVRAGLAPYSTDEDVDRLLAALASL